MPETKFKAHQNMLSLTMNPNKKTLHMAMNVLADQPAGIIGLLCSPSRRIQQLSGRNSLQSNLKAFVGVSPISSIAFRSLAQRNGANSLKTI